MDTDAFDGLTGRVIETLSDEDIKSCQTKIELVGRIKTKFFKPSAKQGGDFSSRNGKSISELVADNLERLGKVEYIKDDEPKEYRVETINDRRGVPTNFIVRQYRSREAQTVQTPFVNESRSKQAERLLERSLPQIGLIRLIIAHPYAPRVVHPSNYKFDMGVFKIQYITSKGFLRFYTPTQVIRFLNQKGHKLNIKRKS